MQSTENSPKENSPKRTKKVVKKKDIEPVNDINTVPVANEESFRFVTSLNLKRSFLSGDIKHCKFILKEDSFRDLIMIGIKNGVTWDEVLRALVDRERLSQEPFAGLEHFL